MTEGAAHLVDNILPVVPYRQFVVTFPFPMRYWLNTNKALFSATHKTITDAIQELLYPNLKDHSQARAKDRCIKQILPFQPGYDQTVISLKKVS